MNRSIPIAVLIAFAFLPQPAAANVQHYTSSAWLKDCASRSVIYFTRCFSYLEGVLFGAATVDAAVSPICKTCKHPILFDIPDNETTGQMVEIVKKYIRAHPESSNLDVGSVILMAAAEAFPPHS